MNSNHIYCKQQPSLSNRCIALILALLIVLPSIISIAIKANAATSDFPCYGTVVSSNRYGGLKLRDKATTNSKILAALPDNTVVPLLGLFAGNWYRTFYNGQEGYINASYVKITSKCPEGIVVNSNAYGGVMARRGPGTNYTGLYRVSDGTKVHVLSNSKDKAGNPWYLVLLRNDIVYMSGNYVSLTDANDKEESTGTSNTNATVTASKLTVRVGPSTGHKSIGFVSRNDRVLVLSEENGWFYISYPGHDLACVSSKYIKLDNGVEVKKVAPKSKQGYVTSNILDDGFKLNVRSGAGTFCKKKGELFFGEPVSVIGEKNNFYKILLNGETLYASKTYITLDGNSFSGMAKVTGGDSLDIYQSRNARNGNQITKVIRGAVLRVLQTYSSGWCKVEANGLIGFIKKKNLTFLSYEDYANLPKGGFSNSKEGILGKYSDNFGRKHSGAQANIVISSEYIDSTVVYPGQTYSFYAVTHPKGAAYKNAPIISGDDMPLSPGGGLCFSSSTLYGAIQSSEDKGVQTGLNLTSRYLHSKGGLGYKYEATIASYYLNFCFRNTNTYPVKVIAKVSGTTLTITIVKA